MALPFDIDLPLQLKGIFLQQISTSGKLAFPSTLVLYAGAASFEESNTDDMIESLRRQIYLGSAASDRMISCIVCHMRETQFIENLQMSLNKFMDKSLIPRLIFLSDFLTWSRGGEGPVVVSEDTFLSRRSNAGCKEQFVSENILYSLRLQNFPISVVYTGLVYGESGCDLQEFFQFLWSGDAERKSIQLAFLASGRTCPLIHIDDLSSLLCDTAIAEQLPPFLIVASDTSSWNLQALLTDKPEDLEHVRSAASALDPVHPENLKDILRMVQVNVTPALTVASKLKYPRGLYDFFDSIWNEFTSRSGLRPFRVLLAGPPQVGKTLCARTLSTLLDIPVVDIVSAVKYILFDESLTVSRFADAASSLRVALTSEVEKLAADTGSKKKGAEAFDIKTVNITDTLLSSVTAGLLVDCLKIRVDTDKSCIRKGFILDVWMGPFQQMDTLYALLVGNIPEEADVSNLSFTGALDIIVEVAASDETLTQRWLVQNGQDAKAVIAKLPKDIQPLYKIFETNLSQYNLKMSEVSLPDGGSYKTHQTVDKLKSAGTTALNFDLADATVDSVCAAVKETCLLDASSFGWIRNSSFTASSPTFDFNNNENFAETKAVNIEDVQPTMSADDIEFIMGESGTYVDYSLATVLPSLAKVYISIAREKPADPLLFAIESLTEIADQIEKAEERVARDQFDTILANSRTNSGTSTTTTTTTMAVLNN